MNKITKQKNKNFLEYEKRIIDATIRLLKSDRKTRISIANVVIEANITRPTFYLHFNSIEDVYKKIEDRIVEQYVTFFEKNYSDYLNDKLLDVQLSLASKIKQNSFYFTALANSSHFGDFIRRITLEACNALQNNIFLKNLYKNTPEIQKKWWILSDYSMISQTLNCWAAKLRGDIDADYETIAYWIADQVYKANFKFWKENGWLKKEHDYQKEFFDKFKK